MMMMSGGDSGSSSSSDDARGHTTTTNKNKNKKSKNKEDDGRGRHWAAKVGTAQAPEPWRCNRLWAEKRVELEGEFVALAAEKGIVPPPRLPWDRYPCQSVVLAARAGQYQHADEQQYWRFKAMGNTNKLLWMHLTMCGWRNMVYLETSACLNDGFMGILRVVVRAEARAAFDRGLFPTIEGFVSTACDVAGGRPFGQRKTLIKIWHSAGLREARSHIGFEYDEGTRERMRSVMQRADDKRRAKRAPSSSAPPLLPPGAPRPRKGTAAAAAALLALPLAPGLAAQQEELPRVAAVPVVSQQAAGPVLLPASYITMHHHHQAMPQLPGGYVQELLRKEQRLQAARVRVAAAEAGLAHGMAELREAYRALAAEEASGGGAL